MEGGWPVENRSVAIDERAQLTPAGRNWVDRTQGPLDALAWIFLVNLILIWSFPEGPPTFVAVTNAVSWLVWACFAVDYLARLVMSADRGHYARTHKTDLLMVLLPMLRLLRVFLLLRRSLASVSTEKIAGSILSIVVVVVFAAAYFMWRAEYDAPGATITTFRTALWWAVVTTTTVGYGDYSPVTEVGRLIATVVMIVGIGLIGTVSATVAAWFVRRPSEPEGEPEEETPPQGGESGVVRTATSAELVARLDALAAQQEEIKVLLDELRQSPGNR